MTDRLGKDVRSHLAAVLRPRQLFAIAGEKDRGWSHVEQRSSSANARYSRPFEPSKLIREDNMPEDRERQGVGTNRDAHLDTYANVLQQTFKHYMDMAMDHHTKAGTTSHILLIITGAIIGLLKTDGSGTAGALCISGIAVFALGCFGMVWVWKQHELYYFWHYVACEYQGQLAKILPGFVVEKDLREEARTDAASEFGRGFAQEIDRYLWLGPHGLVAVTGIVMIVIAAWQCGVFSFLWRFLN